MGTLDDLVAKDGDYRAKVAACAHDFTMVGEHSCECPRECTRCGISELFWLRSEVTRIRELEAKCDEGDTVNAPPAAAICGQNAVFPPERMGCGKPISACDEVYRCTECAVPFHRTCTEKHFDKSAASRQAVINDLTRAIATMRALLREVLGSEDPPKMALFELGVNAGTVGPEYEEPFIEQADALTDRITAALAASEALERGEHRAALAHEETT